MNADDEGSAKKRGEKLLSDNITVSLEKSDVKKSEKSDAEDPKPRIVLTFRSEKSNTKTTNMKIVSTEEKHEEVSPRRSGRTRGKWDWVCDTDSSSPKKDKSQPVSETDESDSSHAPPKRTRRRSKDENIIANAIARKEKSYNEATPGPTQRLSRRIKPTAKILANEELRIGVESQNNARLGIQSDKSPEEGVRTRRSAKPAHEEKQKVTVEKTPESTEVVEIDDDSQNSDMKVKHLCKLGLKAIELEETEDSETKELCEETELLEDDEEIDDDSEVISKLLQADEESDEEFLCTVETSKSNRPRRSTRLCSSVGMNDSDQSSPAPDDEKISTRRSSRKAAGGSHSYQYLDSSETRAPKNQSRTKRKRKTSGLEDAPAEDENMETLSTPAGGEEGAEAACPPDETAVVATCLCEAPSNVYADPEELTDPVFCQAISIVEGVRVGCSRAAGTGPLRRAGPRAPYFLACSLHEAQLAAHMCCPACGLFCTQGIFYQCSEGHLFHTECGLPYNESNKRGSGCPHCGVLSYRWQPANARSWRVQLHMTCSDKRIFLPDQRAQPTPAYLGFTSTPADTAPVIPPDLLPAPAVLKQLKDNSHSVKCTAQELCTAVLEGDTVENIIPRINSKILNKGVSSLEGGTSLHAAAKSGNLAALHVLHAAGGNISATDNNMRTPLMVAIMGLVDKLESKKEDSEPLKEEEEGIEEGDKEKEVKKEKEEDIASEREGASEEDLMKVIRYLVAAGCDVDTPEQQEGLSPLHVCAAHGLAAAARVVAERADVDCKDHGQWTPLVWAAENNHHEIVRLLLSLGADAVSADGEGNTSVMWAARAAAPHALQLLLDRRPAARAHANLHGDTPLHIAARQGNYACVVILLARGARCDVENAAGETPLDVCSGACHTAISLHMQMTMRVEDNPPAFRLLSSDISNGREKFPIPCVNEWDAEPAPADFTYVTQHVTPRPVLVDTSIQTMQGCGCEGACDALSCACVAVGVRAWWARGRLRRGFPHHDPPVLFHCNQTCACNHKRCENRTVTSLSASGSIFTPALVRRGAAGWALAAAARAPRGTPVGLYCGELLTLPEADARTDDTYMFALDLNADLLEQCSDKTLLCVDARVFGNAARFVNHSCAPNLAPVRVFTHTRDLRLPAVVLFALRDIEPGEEFTFDYGEKFWSVKSKFMRCECGTPECRYPVKITEETES